jgi:hypothetical protein
MCCNETKNISNLRVFIYWRQARGVRLKHCINMVFVGNKQILSGNELKKITYMYMSTIYTLISCALASVPCIHLTALLFYSLLGSIFLLSSYSLLRSSYSRRKVFFISIESNKKLKSFSVISPALREETTSQSSSR